MKKIALLLAIFQILAMQSQVYTSKSTTKKGEILPGKYIANTKGQSIKLTINEDATYDMSFFFGKYSTKRDTIFFNNNTVVPQKFVFKPIADAPFSSTLKLKLNYDLSYYYSAQIYIGTQTDENRKINYKLLKDYFKENNEDPTQQNIEVEKSKFLYIVDAKYEGTTVYKFQISDAVNEAELEYNTYSNADTKLLGYVDATTNKFVVSDGKYPILFEFEDEKVAISKAQTDVTAVEVKSEKNWLKNNGFEGDQATAESYDTKPPYVFKHKVASSLSSALSDIKKTPAKFLVVFYDPKNKNAKTEYDNFIKTSEESLSSYMYSEYSPTYDNFNFYLASDKDKSLLSKNKINSDKEILILNSQGALLYHTTGNFEDKSTLFSIYNSIYEELKTANEKLEFDTIVNNKNTSVKDMKATLRKAITYESKISEVTAQMAVDAVKFTPPVVIDAIKEEVKEEIKLDPETAVDSAATAIGSDYSSDYYDLIKDKENLYKLKATKDAVLANWKKVFDAHKNSKTYDKEFVQILKAELANTGFSQKLFPKIDFNTTELDFELLDYVLANYTMLSNTPKEETKESSVEEIKGEPLIDSYEPYYYEQDIDATLESFFTNNNFAQNTKVEKLLKYYKKYLEISGFDAKGVLNYLNALQLSIDSGNNQKEYLETFENYFNSIVKENSSIIENLDAAYAKKAAANYDDWTAYKNSFANLANSVSWYLVENSSDINYIKKAVKWSETSLIIEKNNNYYLDTLAQLYYKNGEKQKAIETEKKAIEFSEDGSNTEEYKLVLEKMKNGTY